MEVITVAFYAMTVIIAIFRVLFGAAATLHTKPQGVTRLPLLILTEHLVFFNAYKAFCGRGGDLTSSSLLSTLLIRKIVVITVVALTAGIVSFLSVPSCMKKAYFTLVHAGCSYAYLEFSLKE